MLGIDPNNLPAGGKAQFVGRSALSTAEIENSHHIHWTHPGWPRASDILRAGRPSQERIITDQRLPLHNLAQRFVTGDLLSEIAALWEAAELRSARTAAAAVATQARPGMATVPQDL